MPKSYRFLILDTYYPRYLTYFYDKFSDASEKDYASQKEFIMKNAFGTADFYSNNLKMLGCEADEIIPNNEILQKKWAEENNVRVKDSIITKVLKRLPIAVRLVISRGMLLRILESQIRKWKPDILYMQDLSFCPPDFLLDMKKRYVKLIVGQIACPLPVRENLAAYDLILTSFPHYVERFRKMGIHSEYLKLCFEKTLLDRTGMQGRNYQCTFVGGISPAHKEGNMLLEELAGCIDMDFFGYGAETLDKASRILARHHGEVWGLDMYKALLASKITINRHIDVAENYANNMRLYEATGCGAMLLTDYRDNLNDLFTTGEEVVAYKNTEELIEYIKYYSEHDSEREKIAMAGQRRTLAEHNYSVRMSELVEIIRNYL